MILHYNFVVTQLKKTVKQLDAIPSYHFLYATGSLPISNPCVVLIWSIWCLKCIEVHEKPIVIGKGNFKLLQNRITHRSLLLFIRKMGGSICPGKSLSSGVSLSRGVTVQWGLCSEGSLSKVSLSRGISVQDSLCSGGRRVSVQGVCVQWGLCPVGSVSSGVCVHGGLCLGVSVQGFSIQ